MALGSGSVACAVELPDYVRYREDAGSSRLEVAVRTLALPSGQTVDLIGVVHIADAAYYQELNRRFGGYDSVLFELVGDPRALTERAPPASAAPAGRQHGGTVSFIQQAAGRYLDLSFQLDVIDYSGSNMVHADTSMEQFQQLQAQRGESTVSLFMRAMEAQLKGQLTGQLDRRAASELDTFGLIRILLSEDSAAAFKQALAKNFDQMESMSALMEGEQGSVILSGRNQVVVDKISEVLARKKQRRIAVFYGGAHMPGIETALVSDMKARVAGEEWLAAWTMKPRAGKTPAPGTTKPAS
jgi:hypothetical protein